jgi:hypothetical protein
MRYLLVKRKNESTASTCGYDDKNEIVCSSVPLVKNDYNHTVLLQTIKSLLNILKVVVSYSRNTIHADWTVVMDVFNMVSRKRSNVKTALSPVDTLERAVFLLLDSTETSSTLCCLNMHDN